MSALWPVFVGALTAVLTAPFVEALKLWLTRRSWAAQERWKLKVSLYERLLLNLDKLHNALEPDYSTSPPTFRGKLKESDQLALSQSLSDLEGATALATLWLPPATAQALRYVRGARNYSDPSTWHEDLFNAVFKARQLVLETVKRDLKL